MRTEQALFEFLASPTAANLSKETITWYRNRLLPFARACPTLPRRPKPIKLFLSNMTSSHETKWDVYWALKTFYKFIEARRPFPNPMKDIKAPRRPKLVMPTLESGEIIKLLQSVYALRERAILTLIIDTGVRAGEVCSFLKQNIRQKTVIVTGKTGWREVPISEETRNLLLQVAATSPYDYVFHNSKGPLVRPKLLKSSSLNRKDVLARPECPDRPWKGILRLQSPGMACGTLHEVSSDKVQVAPPEWS